MSENILMYSFKGFRLTYWKSLDDDVKFCILKTTLVVLIFAFISQFTETLHINYNTTYSNLLQNSYKASQTSHTATGRFQSWITRLIIHITWLETPCIGFPWRVCMLLFITSLISMNREKLQNLRTLGRMWCLFPIVELVY